MNNALLKKLLQTAILIGCVIYLLTFCFIAVQQIRYPYELEWMEGGMVDQVARVMQGKSMYRAPEMEFVPYTYTPLYFHICARVAQYTGLSFMPLRLVAFLSTLGCLAAIFLFVYRETKTIFYAFLSCGLFAAMYRLGGSWYAIARADMLLFFLMLTGICLLRCRRENIIITGFAALLFCLAFFCKQTALFVCVPVALYTMIFFKGINRVVFPLVIALVIPLSTWWFNGKTDGWYSFYIFELPGNHRLVPFRIISFWLKDILAPLFITVCLSVVYALQLLKNKNYKTFFFAFFVLGGLFGVAFLVRIRTGSFVNTVLPAYLGAALYFGIAAHATAQTITLQEHKSTLHITLLCACLAQLLLLFYDPTVQIPTQDDRSAGDQLIELIECFPGDVYIPAHGYYASMAGKPMHAQQVASYDIERSKRPDIIEPFTNLLSTAISTGRFDAIILDYPWFTNVMQNYTYRGDVFNNDDIFWPVTGRQIRPKALYVREDLNFEL